MKRNAIIFAKEDRTVGVGAGQMSRVISVEIASQKAGDESKGAVMASDAFFPFPDGIEAAAAAGITAVAQPGGSKKDGDIIAAGMSITESRDLLVDFSDPLSREINEVIVTGPGSPELNSLDDLAGKQVWAKKGGVWTFLEAGAASAGDRDVRLESSP